MSATATDTFRYVRPGFHVHDASGLEIRRGLDTDDGYDRWEWVVWTANMGRALAVRDTLPQAKAAARAIIRRAS